MIEDPRGCGYRKVGGTYLIGEGIPAACDMIPLPLEPCHCCSFEIPFSRGFMWVHKGFWQMHSRHHHEKQAAKKEKCRCEHPNCPLCHPGTNNISRYGLMWVGAQYYTPASFVQEARKMKVCKRISAVPRDLEIGKTWILLAHKKVPFQKKPASLGEKIIKEEFEAMGVDPETIYKPAVFYAFIPTKVERMLWESQRKDEKLLKELEEKGITPVFVPDGDEDHDPTPNKKKKRKKVEA